jgi:hypothetical protein
MKCSDEIMCIDLETDRKTSCIVSVLKLGCTAQTLSSGFQIKNDDEAEHPRDRFTANSCNAKRLTSLTQFI